jgi:hypothetical protein
MMLSIDTDVLRAVYDYSRDSGERLDDIYDQALRDYLKKKASWSVSRKHSRKVHGRHRRMTARQRRKERPKKKTTVKFS